MKSFSIFYKISTSIKYSHSTQTVGNESSQPYWVIINNLIQNKKPKKYHRKFSKVLISINCTKLKYPQNDRISTKPTKETLSHLLSKQSIIITSKTKSYCFFLKRKEKVWTLKENTNEVRPWIFWKNNQISFSCIHSYFSHRLLLWDTKWNRIQNQINCSMLPGLSWK